MSISDPMTQVQHLRLPNYTYLQHTRRKRIKSEIIYFHDKSKNKSKIFIKIPISNFHSIAWQYSEHHKQPRIYILFNWPPFKKSKINFITFFENSNFKILEIFGNHQKACGVASSMMYNFYSFRKRIEEIQPFKYNDVFKRPKIFQHYNSKTVIPTGLKLSDSASGHRITLYSNFEENRRWSGVNLHP